MNEFIYPIYIYYEDTDFNGFVYFTNYLKYMERATTQLIADKGIKASDLIKLDALIAVRSLQCDYFRPAKLDDRIEVVSKIHEHTEVTIKWDQTIRSEEDKAIIYCHALIERVCINRQLFPIKIPELLFKLISEEGEKIWAPKK